jgi:hypothetical protein
MYTHKSLGPPTTRPGPGKNDQPLGRTDADSSIDLLDALQHAWFTLCRAYDVIPDLPDLPSLFDGADLNAPDHAAETIVANMLLEVVDAVGRYSPAYAQPCGLILAHDPVTDRGYWTLSPETKSRWCDLFPPLATAIERNVGLILAADLIENLSEAAAKDRVLACCLCLPARVILVNRALLDNHEIICDACQHPFHLIESLDQTE